MAVIAGLTGCIVPAPVDPVGELAQPLLVIQDSLLKPPTVQVVSLARSPSASQEFRADAAVKHTATKLPLHYYWYYDLPVTVSRLGAHSMCGDSPTCTLFPCNYLSQKDDVHKMLLIVADQRLPSGESDPTRFPTGTVFDSVQWQIRLTGGSCDAP